VKVRSYEKKVGKGKTRKKGKWVGQSYVRQKVDIDVTLVEHAQFTYTSVTDARGGVKRKDSNNWPSGRPYKRKALASPVKSYLDEGVLSMINNKQLVEIDNLEPDDAVKIISNSIASYLNSEKSGDWLNSKAGKKFMSHPAVQALLLTRLIDNPTLGKIPDVTLCIVCQDNPKDAAIMHGKISHQVACYKCAKNLFRNKKSCPVCRRKILSVTKHIIA